MATVSKIPDLDSGVASPEVVLTPEGQVSADKSLTMGTSSATADKLTVTNSTESKSVDSNSVADKKDKSVISVDQDNPNLVISDDTEDDEESVDESLVERLLGLTEMFPESLRSAISTVTSKTKSLIKGTYHLSRQIVWIGVSSSIILFAPVMFEVERYNVEEMVKQDRNRLVLGPGSAMSGPPGPPGLPGTSR